MDGIAESSVYVGSGLRAILKGFLTIFAILMLNLRCSTTSAKPPADTASIFDTEALSRWIKERINHAVKGEREIVTLPIVRDSRVYVCSCPEYFVGVFHAFTGKPLNWISITPESRKFLPKEKHIYSVRGYFTGKIPVFKDEGTEIGTPEFQIEDASLISNKPEIQNLPTAQFAKLMKKDITRNMILGTSGNDDGRVFGRHTSVFDYFFSVEDDLFFYVENKEFEPARAPLIFKTTVTFTGAKHKVKLYYNADGDQEVFGTAYGVTVGNLEVPQIFTVKVLK